MQIWSDSVFTTAFFLKCSSAWPADDHFWFSFYLCSLFFLFFLHHLKLIFLCSFSISLSSSFSTYPLNVKVTVLRALLTFYPCLSGQCHPCSQLPSSFILNKYYWDLPWCQALCCVLERQTCIKILLPSRRQIRKQTAPLACICDLSSVSLGTQRHVFVGESGKAFWRKCLDCSQFRLFSWNVSQLFYT